MKVTIIESKQWSRLSLSNQGLIESAVILLPGARIEHKSLESWSALQTESILVFTLDFETAPHEIKETLKYLHSMMPFDIFFALHFVILSENNLLNPADLANVHWVEVTDRFSDSAILASISCCFLEHPEVFRYQLTNQLSAAFREVENLKESLRIQATLTECEDKVTNLEKKLEDLALLIGHEL